jgi:centractin
VVIDNGSGVIKAGFAGAASPSLFLPTAIGRPKHNHSNMIRVYGGKLEGSEYFVGSKCHEHRGILKITYPVEHGIVKDWADMERIWNHLYSKDSLESLPSDQPINF